MQYVLYYFIAVSVIGAIVCIYDKLAAARGWRRVPERTLFFWALIGGGPGVYATMLIIRHKTLHHIFMLGIPAIMILQGAIIVGIYNILYMNLSIFSSAMRKTPAIRGCVKNSACCPVRSDWHATCSCLRSS